MRGSEYFYQLITGQDLSLPAGPKNSEKKHDSDTNVQTIIEPKDETKTKTPSMYKVVLLNDDYTPMDFVVSILIRFFSKSEPEAATIMLQVHQQGKGVAGVYPFEVAETKAFQVQNYAKIREHPLKCTIEKE